MIIVNTSRTNIYVPISNRDAFDRYAYQYLWLQSLSTHKLYVVRCRVSCDSVAPRVVTIPLRLPPEVENGEYDYYFTSETPGGAAVDFTSGEHLGGDVYCFKQISNIFAENIYGAALNNCVACNIDSGVISSGLLQINVI